MLVASVIVIAIILFLVLNRFFNITYIGFGAIWKIFFVCLVISTGIVSGVSSLFNSEKEPTVEEVLTSVQELIEDELIDLQAIQNAVDTDTLTRSMNEVYQEMEDRKSNIVIVYQFNVAGNTKVNLENKKIATKVNQLDDLYTTYLNQYNQFIQSIEGKEDSSVSSSDTNSVSNQEDGVNGILGQMNSNVMSVNQELEKQLDNYSKRMIRQEDLLEFSKENEVYFNDVASYRSQLNINMVELSNYWTLLDALDKYEDLIDYLEFYLNENEIERDLDTISSRAGLRLRRFILDTQYVQHDLQAVDLNEPEEEIALINKGKNTITDETLAEVVGIYLEFLMNMASLDIETFDVYGETERPYMISLINQLKQLVEKYEEVSGGITGYGRMRLNQMYQEYDFLSDY